MTNLHLRVRLCLLVSLLVAWGCNDKTTGFEGKSANVSKPVVVQDKEFAVSVEDTATVKFKPPFGLVEERLTLRRESPTQTTIKQIERPYKAEEFQQGHDAAQAEEEFAISTAGKLDLLVVVDNSSSMDKQQKNLADRLQDLTDKLANVDWQIGVITTDSIPGDNPGNGDGLRPPGCQLRNHGKPIKKADPDAIGDFYRAVKAGKDGDPNERGIRNSILALNGQCPGGSNSWIRSDAAFAILFLTDEDSYCSGDGRADSEGHCTSEQAPETLIHFLQSPPFNTGNKAVKAYALTWWDPNGSIVNHKTYKDPACSDYSNDYTHPAMRYIQIVDALDGLTSSICQKNFSNTLKKISENVARIVKREFKLKASPVSGTLEVQVDGRPFDKYVLDGQIIRLSDNLESELKLVARYRHDPTPKFDRVILREALVSESLNVSVNGQKVSNVTFDTVTRELQFSEMPPDDAMIKVRYRLEEDLPKAFDLANADFSQGIIKVSVDDMEEKDASYDAQTKTLSLPTAPKDGATIQVSARGPKVTEYQAPAVANPELVQNVAAHDQISGLEVPFKAEGNKYVFAAGDVEDGKVMIFTYSYGDKDTVLSHPLANLPIEGSLSVSVEGGVDGCPKNVTVHEQFVTFGCDASDLGEVTLTYKFIAERRNQFVLDSDVPAGGTVQVFVNGQAVTEWSRQGRIVTIPSEKLADNAKVRVLVSTLVNVEK